MSPFMYFLLLVPMVTLAIVTLVGITLLGLHVAILKIAGNQFVSFFLTILLLLVWGMISFAAFVVFYISNFSESMTLKPALILIYELIGLVLFWIYRYLETNPS